MTSPLALSSGPPELPGLIWASVWIHRDLMAEMMPTVAVAWNPNGEPNASTGSPIVGS